jgi:DNA repair protein RecN (Recombination protein N)
MHPGRRSSSTRSDAGIGGAVADVVGARLQRLGATLPVLCITHLPQIAAYGRRTIASSKASARPTVTDVARVERRQREEELARMIGGTRCSEPRHGQREEMLAFRGRRERSSLEETERLTTEQAE